MPKMRKCDVDIFPSTYRHDFIYFDDVKRPARPYFHDEFRLTEEQSSKFRSELSDAARKQMEVVDKLNIDAFEEENARILKERMKSVYMVDYQGAQGNERQKKMDFSNILNPEKDSIIVIAEKMYIEQPKSVPVRPLPSSRRLYGYCSLKDHLTGHSEYQDTISKFGYEIIRRGLDKGLARLGPLYDYKKAYEEVKRIKERAKGEEDLALDIKPIDYQAIRFKPTPFEKKIE